MEPLPYQKRPGAKSPGWGGERVKEEHRERAAGKVIIEKRGGWMHPRRVMGKGVGRVCLGVVVLGCVWWLVDKWEIWTEWWMTGLELYGLSVTVVLMLVAIGVGIVSWMGNRRLMAKSMREEKGREVRPFYLGVVRYLRDVERDGMVRGGPRWDPEGELEGTIMMSEGALEEGDRRELRRVLDEGKKYHGGHDKKEASRWAKEETEKMKEMFRKYLDV